MSYFFPTLLITGVPSFSKVLTRREGDSSSLNFEEKTQIVAFFNTNFV